MQFIWDYRFRQNKVAPTIFRCFLQLFEILTWNFTCLLKCFTSNYQVKFDSVKKRWSYKFFNMTVYRFFTKDTNNIQWKLKSEQMKCKFKVKNRFLWKNPFCQLWWWFSVFCCWMWNIIMCYCVLSVLHSGVCRHVAADSRWRHWHRLQKHGRPVWLCAIFFTTRSISI